MSELASYLEDTHPATRKLTVCCQQHTMNTSPMAEPVFYDPRRARWKRLRRAFDVTAVVVSALIIFFVFTALRDEPLPELLFSPQKRAFQSPEGKRAGEGPRTHQESRRALPPQIEAGGLAGDVLNQSEGIRAAFYVPWDAASFSSLRLRPSDRHALSRLAARAHRRMGVCRVWTTRPTSTST